MLKIGIDLDGVVFDSATTFRTYEEIYDVKELKKNSLIDKYEPNYQQRYNWSIKEQNVFAQKYFLEVSQNSTLMAGFKKVYELLKKEKIEFIVISARGGLIPKMIDDATRILKENNIVFDKYYFKQSNKLDVCQKEKIDLMIDDDYHIIELLSNSKIKTLYYRDTNLKKLEENNYLKELNNWGEIYRYIMDMIKENNNENK